ncbi:hypothetical protein [Bacillus sp. ISL-57]|nr:hypothetical protein [Bacillus sp. ISL-57]
MKSPLYHSEIVGLNLAYVIDKKRISIAILLEKMEVCRTAAIAVE